jgi:ERCC4-type nuclease
MTDIDSPNPHDWDFSVLESNDDFSSDSHDWDFSVLESDDDLSPDSTGLTIVVDTREKKPYKFQRFDVDIERRCLETGDYSVKGYESQFAVERKSKDDFLNSCGADHDRFREQVKRADVFEYPMAVVIEAPRDEFYRGHYFKKVHPNVIRGTVEGWECFNIEWYFESNRLAAEQKTYELLRAWEQRFSTE